VSCPKTYAEKRARWPHSLVSHASEEAGRLVPCKPDCGPMSCGCDEGVRDLRLFAYVVLMASVASSPGMGENDRLVLSRFAEIALERLPWALERLGARNGCV
jgi:hypothetical protein